MSSSLHEGGVHKILEAASYVYADEFDQVECNLFQHSVAVKKLNILC